MRSLNAYMIWWTAVLALMPTLEARASHNLAGQITYTRLGTNTYELLLTTYTDPFAAGVDRCTADIEVWAVSGANRIFITNLADIPRANGPQTGDCAPPARFGIFIRPGIKKNLYRTTFTFSGPGAFELRYFDIARVNGVKNMANSGATAFYVSTVLNNNPFIGPNNSPVLLNDPLDDACLFRRWTHNPGAWDPDGDSLSFRLIPNRQYDGQLVPSPIDVANYQFPNAFGGSFTIDATTGLVTWDAVEQVGIYNIAILVEEWRNGQRIGEVIRDMAIFVDPCQNDPPRIITISDTCVRPGQTLRFEVEVEDPNPEDSLYLFLNNGQIGNNGPFQVPIGPATFNSNFGQPVVGIPAPLDNFLGVFSWDVTCFHLRQAFYQVDFYVHDDVVHGFEAPFEQTLSDNNIVKIRVRPNAVDSVWLTPGNRRITVNWTRNICPTALGYEVYRSHGGSDYVPDTVCCEATTLEAGGYALIAFVPGFDSTVFVDDNNGQGLEYADQYCYRVVTIFPDGLRSCPSADTCARIKRDFVLMLKDSVAFTSPSVGAIAVEWTMPRNIDTVFFPMPYTYVLERQQAGGAFAPIAQNIAVADTQFNDSGLNTQGFAYSYRVQVRDANNQEVEAVRSNQASSIFLTATPAHEAILLSWTEHVPWHNEQYEIYQANQSTGPYTLIQTVPGTGATRHAYRATGLVNGEDYCFFVRGFGSYNDTLTREPLINDSQIACEIPRDTIPPCTPSRDSALAWITPDCEALLLSFNLSTNLDSCALDLESYLLFFSPDSLGSYSLIHTFHHPSNMSFLLNGNPTGSIAGCYRLVAQDTIGNASLPSEPLCFDNCPVIQLPNTFTPNADGINDALTPVFLRSIDRMRVTVFDRWGVMVRRSQTFDNPSTDTQLWDGRVDGGDEAVPGVYFYTIEIVLNLRQPFTLTRTGSVTLLR